VERAKIDARIITANKLAVADVGRVSFARLSRDCQIDFYRLWAFS
jgi:hypothetical protein